MGLAGFNRIRRQKAEALAKELADKKAKTEKKAEPKAGKTQKTDEDKE